jgi:hypothetical protein
VLSGALESIDPESCPGDASPEVDAMAASRAGMAASSDGGGGVLPELLHSVIGAASSTNGTSVEATSRHLAPSDLPTFFIGRRFAEGPPGVKSGWMAVES